MSRRQRKERAQDLKTTEDKGRLDFSGLQKLAGSAAPSKRRRR